MRSTSLCSADTSQLVILDLQIRLLAAMPEVARAAVVKNTEIFLQAAQAMEVPVIYTEQYPKGLGPTVPALMERMPETVQAVEKTGFSCCSDENFRKAVGLAGRRQIILVGQEAHVCVLQTAFDLLAEGYEVFVLGDTVCSRTLGNKENGLARMREAGIIISNLESVLFEWLRDASHPHFKLISTLLR